MGSLDILTGTEHRVLRGVLEEKIGAICLEASTAIIPETFSQQVNERQQMTKGTQTSSRKGSQTNGLEARPNQHQTDTPASINSTTLVSTLTYGVQTYHPFCFFVSSSHVLRSYQNATPSLEPSQSCLLPICRIFC